MKQLVTLKCAVCGRVKNFQGVNVGDVIEQIDASGWRDRPAEYGDLCPDCNNDGPPPHPGFPRSAPVGAPPPGGITIPGFGGPVGGGSEE